MQGRCHFCFSLSLVVFAVLLFWQLSQDAFLRGPDAYYYALQADYWATTGNVKIPDSSVVHRINGLLTRAGMGAETAIRLWTCLALLILGLLSGLLLRRSNSFLMVSVTGWLLLSPSLLFIAIEFSTLFSMLFVWPVVVYFLMRPKPYTLLAIVPALLAVFIHKAAIPLSVAICILLLLENRQTLFRRHKTVFTVFLISGLLVGLYFLRSDHFHWLDLQRLGNWHNLSPGAVTLLSREAVPLAIKLELIGSILLLSVAIVFYLKRTSNQRWPVYYALALMIPAWFPFSADEVLGTGERYAMLMPFLVMLSVLLLASKQTATAEVKPKQAYAAPLLLITLLTASFWRLSYSHPTYLDPDNRAYANISQKILQDDIPMLIAHRGLNFYYKFITHKESFPYEPESHWNKMRIWRLTYNITADEFTYHLPETCHWSRGLIKSVDEKHYYLIREDCWVKFREAVREEENQDLYDRIWHYWRNPSKSRPGFLYRKHVNEINRQQDEFSTF